MLPWSASPARTCRCLMRPTSRSWRFRTSPKWCRRRRPFATGDVMTERKFEALNVPPDALEKGGIEILRASVVDGAVSIALRRAFDDPFTWGVLLVDLARH